MDFVHFDSKAALAGEAREIIRRRAAKSGRNRMMQPHVHLDLGKDARSKPRKNHRDHIIRWRYKSHQPPVDHTGARSILTPPSSDADSETLESEHDLSPVECSEVERCSVSSCPVAVTGWVGIADLKSPALFRSQLGMTLLHNTFAFNSVKGQQIESRFAPWRDYALSPAMEAAIDCNLVQYLYMNSPATTNPGQARKLYHLALRRIKQELALGDARQSDGVLAAIGLLTCICSVGHLLSLPASEYYHHMEGQLSMIQFRGPSAMESDLARDATLQVLPVAILRGFLRRQPSFFAQPDWSCVLERTCGGTPYHRLILLGLRATQAMEHLPLALEGDPSEDLAKSCLDALCDHDVRLRGWLLSWYISDDEVHAPERRPAAAFSKLPAPLMKHLRPENSPLNSFSYWPSMDDAFINVTYYVIRLVLLQCAVELTDRYPAPKSQSHQFSLRNFSAEEESLEMANEICQAVPYMCTSGMPKPALILMRDTLKLVADWYDKRGKRAKSDWCSRMLASAGDVIYKRDVDDPRLHERAFCGVRWMMFAD